jgi:hypothetical protein
MRISFKNVSCSIMSSNNYLKIKVHWPENFGCKANLHPITPISLARLQKVTTTQKASATHVLRDLTQCVQLQSVFRLVLQAGEHLPTTCITCERILHLS